MTMFQTIKAKFESAQFGAACFRETGSISGTNAMLDDAISVQTHLTDVLAYSDPELTGDGFIDSVTTQIFSRDNAPLSLPDLFRQQAEHIHRAERAQYRISASPETRARTIEDLRQQLDGIESEEQLGILADALVNLSLTVGDNCRNLGDSLNALAASLDRLPPHIQNMALRPHLDHIKKNGLVPGALTL